MFTYDPAQPTGQVRLLAIDFDPNAPIFQDADITALLNINSQNVRLAAAQALDIIASNEVYVQKKLRLLDLGTDGPAQAKEFRTQAAELRRQVNEGDGDWTGIFDWAELVLDPFGERERLLKQFARESF